MGLRNGSIGVEDLLNKTMITGRCFFPSELLGKFLG
jgi:hypothetical protein